MMLKGKNALVFGALGAVGSEVARALAREGAHVHLSSRSNGKASTLLKELRAGGGKADFDIVDAHSAKEINNYVDGVVAKSGKIDAVFNAIGIDTDHVGKLCVPATDVTPSEFLEYTSTVVLSQFLTAQSAAQHMLKQKSGVVIFLTATPARGVAPFMVGHSAGHAAIEGMIRALATEWGAFGVRVVGIRSGGMPESKRIQEVLSSMSRIVGAPSDVFFKAAQEKPLLKRMPKISETARVVAFLASDYASSMTAAIMNSSCGEVVD